MIAFILGALVGALSTAAYPAVPAASAAAWVWVKVKYESLRRS